MDAGFLAASTTLSSEKSNVGAKTVRVITEECARIGIEQLTLYCLSSENWKRPEDELEFLMFLLSQYMIDERETMMENNIRLQIIGRRERIPADVHRPTRADPCRCPKRNGQVFGDDGRQYWHLFVLGDQLRRPR